MGNIAIFASNKIQEPMTGSEKSCYTQPEDDEIDNSEDTSSDSIITQPFSPSDIRISNPPMNLGDLIDMIEYGWIDFEADYQREDNLWSPGKQSRLIESALLGLRLPAFYFEEVTKKKWRIIDGLQRCSSIRNFCVDKTLALSELEFLKFEGRKFDSFDFELRRDLRMLPITVNILQAGVPDGVKYILFKRLNTGGEELTPQEIRNSMFQGPATEFVKRLSINPEFIVATQNKIPKRRKQDQDFVSRFMAFYLIGYEAYTPDIENFINKAMIMINKNDVSENKLEEIYQAFSRAMHLAYSIFGKNAFRKISSRNKRGPINKALFEVVAVTFAKLRPDQQNILELHTNQLNNELTALLKDNNDNRFSYALSTTTGRPDNVRLRFKMFGDLVQNLLDND